MRTIFALALGLLFLSGSFAATLNHDDTESFEHEDSSQSFSRRLAHHSLTLKRTLVEFIEDECQTEGEDRKVLTLLERVQNDLDDLFESARKTLNLELRQQSSIMHLDVADKEQLKEVFYGGLPHVVHCAKDSDRVHRVFEEAASVLKVSGVMPVTLDCEAPLPSGQSTRERFFPKDRKNTKDDDASAVTLFTVADGGSPRIFTLKLDTKSTSEEFVDYVVKRTAASVTVLKEGKDLKSACLSRKNCVLVVPAAPLGAGSEELTALEKVAAKNRGVSFVQVPLSQFKLNIEKELPASDSDIPPPRLLFLTQGAKKDAPYKGKYYSGRLDESAVSEFLTSARAGKSLITMKKTPSVTRRRNDDEKDAPSSSSSSSKRDREARKKEEKEKEKEKEKKMTKEELVKKLKEAEEQRKKEMEKEAKRNHFYEDDSHSGDLEEPEIEVITLDDEDGFEAAPPRKASKPSSSSSSDFAEAEGDDDDQDDGSAFDE
eukprot:TRINITY_DN11803_c0_g1::TRINITY_DN11803_c0_g1_i1::g.11559::m.11559 TRINITY_DN11803_c0_g1::TRINITY_DN11803_c0_g1_i1::g.11559  ORF type:complete len:500 (+),score=166.75,Adeno_terminal/PF02459.10/0.004,DDHD/PF02862.12/3.9,Neur_chan_memb/PF02932.11/42,Neur_chan_memb/PF02932.11/39,Ycf1/PF05758.7/5.3e+02,Ycf1/PF05758.7/3.2,DUF607/PF04678.8/4.2e+03,DUF607/PF04678.8/13 TRINITY_DN11803_c0_g1_i1:38-1501(+)